MSDAGHNFIPEKIQRILQKYGQRARSSIIIPPPKQWKNGDTNVETDIALMQISSAPLGQRLLSSETLLFNHPTRIIMPILNRPHVNTVIMTTMRHWWEDKQKLTRTKNTVRNYNSIPIESPVVVQRQDLGL